MRAWINGPAKRPEKTRDRSVNVEVGVTVAGNICLNLSDTVEDSSRQTTWITARLEVARELRVALDRVIREVEARIGSPGERTSMNEAADAVGALRNAATDHEISILDDLILRAGLERVCEACGENTPGNSDVCDVCGFEVGVDHADDDGEEE